MVDLSLAHNSPQADENEQKQGIFTNYMQFMDNVVGKWDSVRTSSPRVDRASKIHGIILNSNKIKIIDPVYIKNYGTLMEYGRPIQERKNYAFYDGYTRLYFELERPDYNSYNSGVGVMFNVKNNLQLYAAEPPDSINMFKLPIIGSGFNRIIYPANSNILSKLNNEGFWIRGRDTGSPNEQEYYTGISAIRLPLQSKDSFIPVEEPFSFKVEVISKGEVKGTLISGCEKNFIRIFTVGKQNGADTILKGDRYPELLLHGNHRIFEADSVLFKDLSIHILTQGTPEQRENITIRQESRYRATIIDSAEGDYNIQYRFKLSNPPSNPGIPSDATSIIFDNIIHARKLFSQDAVDEELKLNAIIGYPVEVSLIKEDELFQFVNPPDNIFELEVNGELVLMEEDSGKLEKLLPNSQNEKKMVLGRSDFITKILNKGKLYLVPSAEATDTLFVRIKPYAMSKEEYKNEKIIVSAKFGQIFAEPITDYIQPGYQALVYNPSGIKVGGTGIFTIETSAETDVAFENIRWFAETVSGGARVSFPEGNSGKTVRVHGDCGEGEVKIKAILPGLDQPGPEFRAKVIKEEEVKVTFYIGYDEANVKLLNNTQINDILQILNETYSQVAMKFRLSPVKKAGIDDSLELDRYEKVDTDEKFTKLVDLDNRTDGLEIYFVRNLTNNIGGRSREGEGIGIAALDEEKNPIDNFTLATTLAHEIGHACKLKDIYKTSDIPPTYSVCDYEINNRWMPDDCSELFNYYNGEIEYCDLLNRLIMFGYSTEGNIKRDIPLGTVYGVNVDNNMEWIKVGLRDMNRKPKHK